MRYFIISPVTVLSMVRTNNSVPTSSGRILGIYKQIILDISSWRLNAFLFFLLFKTLLILPSICRVETLGTAPFAYFLHRSCKILETALYFHDLINTFKRLFVCLSCRLFRLNHLFPGNAEIKDLFFSSSFMQT